MITPKTNTPARTKQDELDDLAKSLVRFNERLDEIIDEAHHGTWASGFQIIAALRAKATEMDDDLQDDMSRR